MRQEIITHGRARAAICGRSCGSALLLACALAASACSGSSAAPDERAVFQVGVQGNTALLRPALTITASAPGFTRTWSGAEITSPAAPNYAPAVPTPLQGTLIVVARLQGADGGVAAEGRIEQQLQPDQIQGVDVWLSGHNPGEGCFGCVEVKAFPVPPAFQQSARDSLYLVRGINSISHPVIY